MNIGIDIDGVVANIIPSLCKAIKSRYGLTIQSQDLTSYNVEDCTPLTKSQTMDIFCDKKTARNMYSTMPIMRNAKSVIDKIKKNHTVIFVTVRNFYQGIQQDTADWLASNGLLRGTGVIFSQDKVAVANNHNIKLFIEDKGETAIKLAEAGMQTLLFNAPYNQGFSHKLITRVKSWKEIERWIT